jgi:selenocysteine lyase/cysteine desulfurase
MHYLDHACFSPPAVPTQQAVLEALGKLTSVVDRDATDLALEWLHRRDGARDAVASLLGATPADVTLVESTTHGMGIVAGGLALRPGDNVVVGDCDFIGLPTVWRAQESRGVELRAARSERGRFTLDSIRQVVDARTRVLVFSAVQEVSGVPLDVDGVAEIAASVDAYLLLDGIQEVGVIARAPALHGVHAYASGGHKWLRSPYGLGFLWTSPSLRAALTPPFQGYFALCPPPAGWPEHLSNPENTSVQPLAFRDDASGLELGGTPNWVGAVGLTEAINVLHHAGLAQPERSARDLADGLRGELLERGIEPVTKVGEASTIVTFSLAPAVPDAEVVGSARRADIRVSARGSAGAHGIRVGCHGHNTVEDTAALLDVVDRCLRRGGRSVRQDRQR